MKNRIFIASALAAATVAIAQADMVNYEFTYTGTQGSGISASGSLVLAGNTATAGSVTVSGTSMDGTYSLLAGSGYSPLGSFIFDNWMDCDADPSLTANGLLFVNAAGQEINIWGNSPGNYSLYGSVASGVYPIADNGGMFDCHKVPAPGALALLGIAGMLGSRRRR